MGRRRTFRGRDPRGPAGTGTAEREASAAVIAMMLAIAAALPPPASAAAGQPLAGTEIVTGEPGGQPIPGNDVGGAGGGGGSAAAGSDAANGDGSVASGGQSLGSRATDPTAGLTSLTFTEIWTPDHWGTDQGAYALRFRPAMPFRAWGIPNILRVSLAFDHGGLPGYGLEDVQIFDLLVFPMGRGRFALGPLVNLASAGSPTPSPFAIGPAIGYVRSSEALNAGLFSQNAWGDEYGISSLQPVFTWHFARILDLSPGDLQYTYDWEAVEWVSVPIGAQLGCLAMAAGQPLRLFAAYQFNFRDRTGAPKNTVQLGLALLVP